MIACLNSKIKPVLLSEEWHGALALSKARKLCILCPLHIVLILVGVKEYFITWYFSFYVKNVCLALEVEGRSEWVRGRGEAVSVSLQLLLPVWASQMSHLEDGTGCHVTGPGLTCLPPLAQVCSVGRILSLSAVPVHHTCPSAETW